MTQGFEICLPTPLSIQVFGRPEDWEWIESDDTTANELPETLESFSADLEQRLTA